MNRKTRPASICVDILWTGEALHGVALAFIDALHAVQLLAQMRRQALALSWRLLDAEGRPRRPAAVRRSASRAAAHATRILVVPGYHARNGPHLDQLVQRDQAFARRLQRAHQGGALVVGVYTGVALLGAAGLLHGRRAVMPWAFIQSLLRQEDQVQIVDNAPWAQDERVLTCDTPALATELALQAVDWAGEPELAEAMRHVLIHADERQRTAHHIVTQLRSRPVTDGMLERATHWMETHLQGPCSVADIARAAATSPRSLQRHFLGHFGVTPLQHLQGLRAARARILLETTYLPVESIAELCGYTSLPMFRRVFLRSCGLNPAAYRERYRLRVERKLWSRAT